jgi:hypothetical protein
VQTSQPTTQRDDKLQYATPLSRTSDQNASVGGQHVQDQIDNSITHVHHDALDPASQLVGLSEAQREITLRNCITSFGGDGSKDDPASTEVEEVLPDDSSLSYIGMAPCQNMLSRTDTQ